MGLTGGIIAMGTQHISLKAVFDHALEIESAVDRKAYLDQACADDPDARQKVEALLAAYQEAGSFLESGPPGLDGTHTVEQPPITEGPGSLIGSYKLLQRIGEGAFGIVYMAQQREPVRRKVALKIIKPGMDTQQVVARFEAERQALAMMDHPNIARVFDGGATDSGRPYFVMELVKGVPITEYCDKNDLSTAERLGLFITVCQAVQHAHQKGVIHRDLKPTNIMVTLHDGQPVAKVIDFGVSKAINQQLTEKTLFTAYGQMVGTPQYMSPEQAEMSGLDVDTRSDIYSLGVLLYELLTGTTPLESDRLHAAGYAEMQRIICEEDPPKPSVRLSSADQQQLTVVAKHRSADPRQLRQLIRGELDWIVMKSLEKERSRRYETPTALAADVERFLHDEPVEACPPSAAYRLRKLIRRNKLAVTAAAAVSVSLLLGIVGTTIGLVRAKSETARAESEAQRAGEAEREAQEEAERRRRQLHATTIHTIAAAWERHDVQRVSTLLDRCDQDLRKWPYYYLRNLLKRFDDARHIPLPRAPLRIAVSPDGKRIAAAHTDTSVATVVDLATGTALDNYGQLQTKNTWKRTFVAYSNSKDAEILAYPSKDFFSVILRNLNTGELKEIKAAEEDDPVSNIALSPDGTILAIATERGVIAVRDLRTEELIATGKAQTDNYGSLTFSPNGDYLAIAGADNTVRIWNARTATEKMVLQGHTAAVIAVAFSPKGKFLASGGADRRLHIWDWVSGKLLHTLMIAEDEVRSLAFSPANDTLAAGVRDGTVRVWSVPTFEALDVVPGYGDMYALDYLPDGTLVFGGQGRDLVLWTPQSPEERGILKCNAYVRDLAFSSTGRLLAATTGSPEIRVWRLEAHRPTQEPSLTAGFDVSCIASSNRGDLAVGDSDSTRVQFFDFASGQSIRTIRGDNSIGTSRIAFSPSGERLVVGCEDGSIIVWQVGDDQPLWKHSAHEVRVSAVCFCSDNTTLLTGGGDGSVRLWDLETGKQIHDFGNHGSYVESVSSSPDGRKLAAGFFGAAPKGLIVWDRSSYRREALLGHKHAVYSVAFLHHEDTLISASGDRMLKAWDLETGQERLTIDGSPHIYSCAAVSPDDRVVAAGSRDGTILIYRAPIPPQ
jgi:WD40 repeat protein/serine/threonine protein kinase